SRRCSQTRPRPSPAPGAPTGRPGWPAARRRRSWHLRCPTEDRRRPSAQRNRRLTKPTPKGLIPAACWRTRSGGVRSGPKGLRSRTERAILRAGNCHQKAFLRSSQPKVLGNKDPQGSHENPGHETDFEMEPSGQERRPVATTKGIEDRRESDYSREISNL